MIFCFGARRSGTYLLQRIVGAHPLVSQVPSETHLFSHGLAPLLERFRHEDPESLEVGSMYVERDLVVDAARDFCDSVFLTRLEPGTERIVERTPLHALHAELIAEIYPDARFVHIIRDGRDVARSIASQPWGPDSVGAAAEEWRDCVAGGRAIAELPNYLELRYEDLLNEPRASVERIYAELEFEPTDDAVEAGLAALAERVNLRPDSLRVGAGKWREIWSEAELAEFERVGGELLSELGYSPAPATTELRSRVEEMQWYHTLQLAPGVESPGYYDLRGIVDRVPLPASLDGMRCLDIGTFDGFWAFEMERRGAREVLAIDIIDPTRWDWPAGSTEEVLEAIARRKGGGEGFEIAREALSSSVRRLELSVYDLDPAAIGEFDFIYLGSLLLHLRDPIGALESVRSVCAGTLVVCDAIDLPTTRLSRSRPVSTLDGVGRPWWWKPNVAALVRMVEAAGFETEGEPVQLLLPPGPGHQPAPRQVRPRWLLSRAGRREVYRAWRGDPHAAVVARRAELGRDQMADSG